MHTVLAVDDSETMRQMVKMTLQTSNYNVVLANDGEEGLNKFISTNDVDLVVTDINMPKMDGIGLIREIRLRNKEVPILALTTESEEAMRRKGAEAGANGWLTKPFKPAQFIEVVKRII
ncbi:MAG TPA: response regulator [Turneriella sp.]|nr:response regulator [Turneriella sp.]